MKKHSLINLSQALILLTKPVLGILVMVFCVPLMLSGLASAQTAPEDFKVKIVKAPDGVLLYAQEWGNASGPEILFIHGFSQSHLSFIKQTRSDLAKTFRMVTYDLRGHGGSDKPSGSEYYKEGKRWAGDVQAVIEALNLKKPVLVGWSMGGRVISQYLTDYGEKRISGINFVSSMTIADPKSLGPGSLNYQPKCLRTTWTSRHRGFIPKGKSTIRAVTQRRNESVTGGIESESARAIIKLPDQIAVAANTSKYPMRDLDCICPELCGGLAIIGVSYTARAFGISLPFSQKRPYFQALPLLFTSNSGCSPTCLQGPTALGPRLRVINTARFSE